MIKKCFIAILLLTALLCFGCSNTNTAVDNSFEKEKLISDSRYNIAMITDSGDITDMSFNQTSYEACRVFSKEHDVPFACKRPNADTNEARNEMTELAIKEGYNIIVLPGYQFASTIVALSDQYPDVKFIVLDISESDILSAALGDDYDYIPENWNVNDYYNENNTYCANYHEEIAGYMAGYAAVKLGYRNLGFVGGIDVPSVKRYGYGYLQGIDNAAIELNIVSDVSVKYAYAGQFFGDPMLEDYCSTWYKEGTEVIFACGGGIYTSICESALKNDGKVIGVDVDQTDTINAYEKNMSVTSAMKGLGATISIVLDSIISNNSWENKTGKIETLGLVSALDSKNNYVTIAENTAWTNDFDKEALRNLTWDIMTGKKTVIREITELPKTCISVHYEEENIL